MRVRLTVLLSWLVWAASLFGPSIPVEARAEVQELSWEQLLPEEERGGHNPAPPPPLHDYLAEGDIAALQTGSFAVNPALNGARAKVPGFIVPLEMTKAGLVKEFFLVPYFGACIHVPPPPPNQIVHVLMKEGIPPEAIDEPQWVSGILHTRPSKSEIGDAAYWLDGETVEAYRY